MSWQERDEQRRAEIYTILNRDWERVDNVWRRKR